MLCAGAFIQVGAADESNGLTAKGASLASAERQALLRLYAAETAVDRARRHVAAVDAQVARLGEEMRARRKYRSIVRASLAASRARVARTLKLLYVDGPPPDALAVILGAESFDEAIDGMDTLRLVADRNRALAGKAAARAARLRIAVARLERASAALEVARSDATASVENLQAIVDDRTRYVASLREKQLVTVARLEQLAGQARVAAARSRVIGPDSSHSRAASDPPTLEPAPRAAAEPTPASRARAETPKPAAVPAAPDPPAPAPTPTSEPAGVDGRRSLVVSVTAYSLSGTTASGLPVGPGIVAVDPSVIPLGTRVFVPGYGEAVAADTGSAVHGNIIDVWLPNDADAVAWGRKSLTITVYRS